jgi:hypothetical protein
MFSFAFWTAILCVKFILMIFFFQRLAVANFVPGFAFTTDDYSKPWEGWKTNLEKYLVLTVGC